MHLDYGPCGIDGPTDPVRVENHYFISKVEVPKKCVDCPHLFFNLFEGFGCNKDGEKWRKGNRGLDWGYWKPDETYFQLPWPKITTPELMRLAGSNDRTAFVSVYRTLNKNKTLAEAVNDFGYLRELILHDREQRKQEAP